MSKLVEAWEYVKAECEKHPVCGNACPFSEENGSCIFRIKPIYWEISVREKDD